MNPSTRRALTLIEVLAAAVLLALVAGTCASMLRSASLALPEGTEPERIDELSGLAQDLLTPTDQAAASVLVQRWIDEGGASLELPWPGRPDRPPVTLHRLIPTDPAIDHAWLEFRCAGARAWRWVHVDARAEERTP